MGIYHFPAAFATALSFVSAAPVSNETQTSWWVPQPKGRGTSGIVLTSVITLTLCVWTALHIDIIPKATAWKRLRKKLVWMIIGLFAPEFVLLSAFDQCTEARKIHQVWCKQSTVKMGSAEDHLGRDGAFFVGMGGFTLGPSNSFSKLPITVSPSGFLQFARMGIISLTDLDQKLILDKGKVDGLGKTVVCIQAFWMAVQCIVRKASGLPITLLELHVVMHVLCTVLTYICWWHKPLDVNEPLPVLQDSQLASLLSVIYSDRKIGNLVIRRHRKEAEAPGIDQTSGSSPTPPDLDGLLVRENSGSIRELSSSTENIHFLEREDSSVHESNNLGTTYLKKEEFLEKMAVRDEVVFRAESLIIGNELLVEFDTPPDGNGTTVLDRIDINNLRLAAAAIRTGQHKDHEQVLDNPPQGSHYLLVMERAESSRMNVVVNGGGGWNMYDKFSDICILLLPPIYGACHATAWNTHFPTPAEQWIWRISSIIVGVGPLPFALDLTLLTDWDALRGFADKCQDLLVRLLGTRLWKACKTSAGVFLALVVGAARIFLMIEAVISLRSLPDGSYKSTPWEDYWPHF